MTTDLICRLCQEKKPLIRAHIIPRTFYRAVKGDEKHALLLKPDASKYTEATQSGITDGAILCADCDRSLGVLDDYGYKVFGAPPAESQLVFDKDGFPVAYSIPCDDVQKVHRFLLSMLWRAGITSHDFFRHVKLGEKNEEALRLLLLKGDAVREEDWEFIVIRFFDSPYDRGIMPPWKGRYPDILAYNFYLPYYNFLIRADRRQFRDDFSVTRFLAGTNCVCLRMPFGGTPEARYIHSIAVSLRNRVRAT